jgi:hypothetical protein
MGDDADAGTKDRQHYLEAAYKNAFGTFDPDAWDPEQGYSANRPRIVKLYDYYRDTYLKQPTVFLWAGLGRMAGGAVVGGLDFLISTSSEGFLTKTMVKIGKLIFQDLAWLHEAFIDDPNTAITLAAQRDAESPARRNYADAFRDIASGDDTRIAAGNQALLENEQFSIIQPQYDAIAQSDDCGTFAKTSAFTGAIHPYHRDFIVRFPQSNVTVANDRWAWITEPEGMWAKWVVMPTVAADERTRLVSLSFDDILKQKFDPVVDALLPTGANDED